ncbi:hypothetical protein VNO78_03806 [Psophocarpus tetragonolobus]|uniref:Uncharacterized protein n=1 Tax=Psophocarpus tetragonolobus TaxID=3891 RepID=A0AAN9XW88_PSOTE
MDESKCTVHVGFEEEYGSAAKDTHNLHKSEQKQYAVDESNCQEGTKDKKEKDGIGDKCLSLNIEGAVRGPLRRPSSFSLGTISVIPSRCKNQSSPTKPQNDLYNSLNDDCIRNQNHIILQKHRKKEAERNKLKGGGL